MEVSNKRFGIKMPNKARYRKCPVCLKPKTAREFRVSNRNPKRDLICWKCRCNKIVVKQFWGGKAEITKRQPMSAMLWEDLFKRLSAHFNKRNKEESEMSKTNKQAADFLKFPERIAAIVGKTYAVMGDDWKLSDDEALTRIRDLLDALDDTLIVRNKKKRLS